MKMTVEQFMSAIELEAYTKIFYTATPEDVQAIGVPELFAKCYSDLENNVRDGKLVEVQLMIEYPEGTAIFTLEANILNLPYKYYKKLPSFFNEVTDEAEVNVYLIVESPILNASKLRIDEITSVTNYLENPSDHNMTSTTMIAEKIAFLENPPVIEEKEPVVVEKKKKPSVKKKAVAKKKKAVKKATTTKKAAPKKKVVAKTTKKAPAKKKPAVKK
ncbi:hypothetical protein ACE83Q_06705 [Dellaglioa sp. P0083]|uniref:hypothetical protein n=1 Tax=Dellaglioa kimchii TaxID=3344667 RepID=UPI0038D4DD13